MDIDNNGNDDTWIQFLTVEIWSYIGKGILRRIWVWVEFTERRVDDDTKVMREDTDEHWDDILGNVRNKDSGTP